MLPDGVMRTFSKGREYYYFQSGRGSADPGPRTRLPGAPPSPEFWAEYARLSGHDVPPQLRPGAGTFTALIADYKRSPEWRAKADSTRQLNEHHLKIIAEILGDKQVERLRASHVLQLRDKIAAEGTLRKADHIVSMLSAIIAWGIPREYAEVNPCREIGKLSGGDGWAPWEKADIDYARENLPVRLWHAAALALHSGQRQGDLIRMDWSMIREGVLHVRQEKTGTRLWIPLHRDLAAVLETIPRVSTRILTNASGRPWQSGFKASWQDIMNTPAFAPFRERRLVFHGLRKSAVNTLLEAGCTEAQVSAITGQSLEMIRHYSRMVDRRKLARAAVSNLDRENGP